MDRSFIDGFSAPPWQIRWRTITEMLSQTPSWLSVQLGVALMALGAFLLVRPLTSLSSFGAVIAVGFMVSGFIDLLRIRENRSRFAVIVAAGWIATGMVMLLAPALTLGGLSLVVVIALFALGVAQIWSARSGVIHLRFTLLALGISSIVFGAVAFIWPDVTLLVLAVVFGARIMLVGFFLSWSALVGSNRQRLSGLSGEHGEAALRRPMLRLIGALTAFFLALGVSALSLSVLQARPALDAFYQPPASVPEEPGRLIRFEGFTTGIPEGSRAWRILYTTTDAHGAPVVSSGLVVLPTEPASAPLPVITWAHGTSGYVENCAPSVLSDPFVFGALFTAQEIIDEGWALVATDYPGMGVSGVAPYLIGLGEAHAVLDSVRAAHELSSEIGQFALTEETVLWGHSQGGHAVLWSGFQVAQYAPELRIAGIAALAPVTDLPGLIGNLNQVVGGSVFASFVVAAYVDTYPDVDDADFVRPEARIIVREMAGRCLAEPAVYASALSAVSLLVDVPIFSTDPEQGKIGQRLRENIPRGSTAVPVLIAQAEDDILILPEVQEAYVRELCAAGQPVDYRLYANRDHPSVIDPDSVLTAHLFDWTAARFRGDPVKGPQCDFSPGPIPDVLPGVEGP